MTRYVRLPKPTPSDADIRRVQTELGLSLRGEYIDFMCRDDSGIPTKNIYEVPPDNHSNVHGIYHVYELYKQHMSFEDRTGPRILPIMFDDCGNYICMDMSAQGTGRIFFLDHEIPGPDALTLLAPSLKTFLEGVVLDDVKVAPRPDKGATFWVDPDFLREIQNKK